MSNSKFILSLAIMSLAIVLFMYSLIVVIDAAIAFKENDNITKRNYNNIMKLDQKLEFVKQRQAIICANDPIICLEG